MIAAAPPTPLRRSGRLVLMDDQTTALIYGRVSTFEQADEGVSLPAQFSEGRRYVGRQVTWIFGDEFQDVESGLRDHRPDYQRMLLAVRGLRLQGRPVVVVVASLDRLGRNVAERVRAWKELASLGVAIHSVREGGIVSEFTYNILAAVAQEESRKLGERVRSSNRHFIEKGWRPVGRAAWGYRWREATAEERQQGSPSKVLEEHPDEAPFVREAWQRHADGESIKSLSRWSTALPAAATGSRRLNFAALGDMFTAPIYVGRPERGDENVLARPRGHWPVLIDDETWQRVRERQELHRRMPPQASGEYPLSGLMQCPACGTRMGGRTQKYALRRTGGTARRRQYVCEAQMLGGDARRDCTVHVPAARFEPVVLDTVGELLDVLNQPEYRQAVRQAWVERDRRARGGNDAKRIGVIERSIDTNRRRLGEAAIKLIDGDLDRAGYDIVRDRLQCDIDDAERELADLRAKARPVLRLPAETLLASVGGWAVALRTSAPGPVRDALAVLIEGVSPERISRGVYEARIRWTPLGLAMLDAVVQVGASGNLVHVERFGLPNPK